MRKEKNEAKPSVLKWHGVKHLYCSSVCRRFANMDGSNDNRLWIVNWQSAND